MVYTTTMGAITITSIKRFVVYKLIKVFIDYISYQYFFGMRVYNFASWIVWKCTFETRGTISVVF